MCAAVISTPARVVVPDARLDPRFAENAFVTARSRSRASTPPSPLITPSGIAIGTLCVFDTESAISRMPAAEPSTCSRTR